MSLPLTQAPSMMPQAWQDSLKLQLKEQEASKAWIREVIANQKKLAKKARDLKSRNRALMNGGAGTSGSAADGPSLIDHLETQMMTLRNELSTLYRTQAASQNKQLQMADALRDRDEEVRGMREEVRLLREAKEASAKKEREWEERWRYRTKDMETLNDEIIAQNLELTSLSQQNLELRSDNAHLVQRWLDKMNLTADEMNVEFEKENAEVKRKEGEGDFQKGGKEREKL